MNKLLKKTMIPILLVIMILLSYMPRSMVVHATPNEATLISGDDLNRIIYFWNSGSSTKVKNLVKADVPSDLMTSTLRYKYETISTSDSPVKVYMWHDMNAYGQYTDTVYFGTEVPGATIYTNEDCSNFLYMFNYSGTNPIEVERIWDSANPSTPYFFNTSRTKDFSQFNLLPFTTKTGNQRVVDLLDVSNAEKLDGLFSDWNKKLAEVGYDMSSVRTWNTSKVKSLRNLFSATQYHSVDFDTDIISNWDVHNVTDISGMYNVIDGYRKTPLQPAWNNGFMNFDNIENFDSLFSTNGWTNNQEINYDVNFTNWNFSKIQVDPYAPYQIWALKGKVKIGDHPFFADNNMSILDYMFKNGQSNAADKYMTKIDDGSTYYLHNADHSPGSDWLGFNNSFVHQVNAGTITPAGTYKALDKTANTLYIEGHTSDPSKGYGAHFLKYDDSLVGTAYTLPNANDALDPDPYYSSYQHINKSFPWFLKQVSSESSYTIGTTFAAGASIILPANGELWLTSYPINKQITYDLDGGTNAPGNPTVDDGSQKTIQDPTKPGKVFLGWYMTTASGMHKLNQISPVYSNQLTEPPEDINLKAIWGTEKTITVHGNGAKEYYSHSTDVTVKVQISDNPTLPDGTPFAPKVVVNSQLYTTVESFHPSLGSASIGYYNGDFPNYRGTWYTNFTYQGNKVLTGISNTNVSKCSQSYADKFKTSGCTFDITAGNDLYLIWEDYQYIPNFQFSPYYSAYSSYDQIESTVSIPNYNGTNREERGTREFEHYAVTLSNAPTNGRYALGPNDHPTFSIEGYETGASDEFIINKYAKSDYGRSLYGMITGFDVYMGDTKLASNVKTYTFSSGVTAKPRLVIYYSDDRFVRYNNLDGTEIETFKYSATGVVPYTYRSTYPSHGQYNGFDVMPVGWTLGKQYSGTDHEGVYVSTGSLPTLYRGTVADMNASVSVKTLMLYPMYSVDVNRDGIADLFQNKNTFTISKALDAPYLDLTSISGFTYNVFLGDVNGDPIKNWTITDTDGNSHTTDNSGIIHLTLHSGESVSLKGILPNMIVWAKETTTGGLIAEHQISYNGTAWVSGADSGNITYQDNTPLTVAFKNTDTRVIVPAGVVDNRTKRLTALMIITILVGLAGFAIIKRVTDRLQM